MEIVELLPQLHLIRPVFGQVYVWQDGSQLTMVDTGIPGSQDDLAAAFAELGYRRADLRRVIITHGHEDHAGSAAASGSGATSRCWCTAPTPHVVRGQRARAHPT